MKSIACFLLAASLWPFFAAAQNAAAPVWQTLPGPVFSLHYTTPDSAVAADLHAILRAGAGETETFFGQPFPHSFDVYIFPSRAALDRQWQLDWGDSTFQSQCWMVASGVGHRLDVLSPRVWAAEACDHNAADRAALQKLLTHELIHVYHGQHNPKPDFAGLDDLAWWIEGLATFAAGQLDSTRIAGVQTLLRDGKAPDDLQKFWSGRHRYGLSGSVVAWIDAVFGRETLVKLLGQTRQDEIFALLQTDEAKLVERWKQYWLAK